MKHLKTIFACLLMAVLSIGQVWADTQAVLNSVSTKEVTSATVSSVSKEFDGVTCLIERHSSNAPGFYTSSGIVRYYGTDVMTLSVESGNTISQIDFVMTSGSVGTASEGTLSSNTWTGNAESVSFTGGGTVKISSITVTYSSGGSTKTLTGVSVSGTPTKTEYYAGQDFDPAGLTVTGTYSDETTGPITSSITWAYNPAQTLELNQTSIGVTATVNEITSAEFTVNGLTVTEAPAAVNYEKVTEAPEGGWSGEYLIVYEPSTSKGRIWTGIDDASCYVETDINADVIAQPEGTVSVTIAEMTGGYSIQVNGGTNDGKYIQNNGSSNGIKFVDAGVANTLAYENSAVTITCNSKKFRYNSSSGQDRFRYFGSDQQVIQLYKKVDGTAKPSAELAYATSSVEKLVGAGAFTNELTNPHTVTVTYASNNTEVVTVDPATGAVTIVAAGVAEITASFAGNDDYKTGSASYTIVITEHAGTELDPYSVADAKIVIDAIGTKENAYVSGIVSSIYSTSLGEGGVISFYISADGATTCQQLEAYKCLSLNSEAFTALSDVETGATVVITGTLKKFNSTYELDQNCHLVSYEAPVAPKQHIANDQANPYTVAQALVYAADGVTYDLDDYVYVRGVVYDVKSFNNGAMNIFIKDADAENSFELFKCAGINDGSATTPFEALTDVQAGDIVIGYGQLTVFNTVYEFKQGNYLVDLDRPAVAVTGIDLTESTVSVEVGSTVTLHASVVPGNATDQGIVWSVTSGSDKASVDENGVVTGTAAGEAVIRAASHEDASIYEECTVTVTAVDPTKHVVTFDATVDQGESPLSKSNITFTCSNGALNNGSEYRLYKSSTTTFECSVGNITKIEFTGVSGNPVSGFGDPEVGTLVTEGNDGVWTGNAASVAFAASGAQVRATLIKVTYKEDNRDAAGLAWNPAGDIELTVGDAFSAPALQNPNNIDAAEITIASDNTDLATVSAGVVSLVADATGTATITATFNGNDDYKPATVSYNITVNEAGLDNVTFDSSEDHAESGETTITKGGFTLSFTSGSMDGTQAEYRLYKSQTMTLSSTDYLIKKIEFTCTSGNPITGFADATGLDKDNNEWTGESNTVELTASNAQVRMTKIKVFYVEDTRAAAGLAWNPADDIELTVGGAFSAPALLNPNSIDAAEISIASSNTDVATVTAGVVALVADATGEATITATFAGNASYKPATVSYKITVNPAYSIYVQPSLNVNFGSVNQNAEVANKSITVTLIGVDAATLTLEGTGASAFTISPAAALTASGDITISASSANIGTFAATLTISDDANNAESKVVNISITVNEVVTPETPVSTTSKWVPATEITDGMQVLIVGVNNSDYFAMGAQANNGTGNNRLAVPASVDEGVLTPGENTMAFTVVEQPDGSYALQTSNDKYLYAASSSNNYLKTKDELDDNGKWTLSVTSAVANGTYTHKMMQFNSSSSIFACYTTSTTTQKPIALYVEQTTPPTPVYETVRGGLTAGNYYTICKPYSMTDVQGATLWSFAGKDDDFAYLVQEEAAEAGKPYIMFATATTVTAIIGSEDAAAGSNNGLYGTLSDMVQSNLDAAGTNIYLVIGNMLRRVDGQTGNSLPAGRAYVKLDDIQGGAPVQGNAPGKKYRKMPMQGQTTTGCELINATEAPAKMMINGQLFILRGEKKYDATGRLVK